ncbi:unnamed protein product, partial [Darwinula stevensoni]
MKRQCGGQRVVYSYSYSYSTPTVNSCSSTVKACTQTTKACTQTAKACTPTATASKVASSNNEQSTPKEIERKEEPCKDPTRWVEASGGEVPIGAVVGGEDGGEALYVARAEHEGDMLPGKLVPSHR